MIVEMKQVKTGAAPQYEFFKGNNLICRASAPNEKGRVLFCIDHKGGRNQQLYYNPSDTSYGADLKSRMSFKIFEQNQYVGRMHGDTEVIGKGKIFNKHAPLYRVNYQGVEYRVYDVGLGKDGRYLCCYYEDTLIFVVEKHRVVKNYQDSYTLYIEENGDMPLAALIMVYIDVVAFSNMIEDRGHSISVDNFTSVPVIQNKFDPEFINRIKAMEEI